MKIASLPLVLAVAGLLASPAPAQRRIDRQPRIEIEPASVHAGDTARYSVVLPIISDNQDIKVLTGPRAEGLSFERLQDSQSIQQYFDSRRGAVLLQQTTLHWRARTSREGRIAIEPPRIEVNGKKISLAARDLSVVGDTPRRFSFLELHLEKERIIREEQVRMWVDVYLGAVRDRRTNSFDSPLSYNIPRPPRLALPWIGPGGANALPDGLVGEDIRTWLAGLGRERHSIELETWSGGGIFVQRIPLPFPIDDLVERDDGSGKKRSYFHARYEVRLTGRTVGSYEIGPAILRGQGVDGDGSRPRAVNLFSSSPRITLSVVEPPLENRPKSWSGAIGSFEFIARPPVPQQVREGESVHLTLIVKGRGSLEGIAFGLEENPAFTRDFQIDPPRIFEPPAPGTQPPAGHPSFPEPDWRQFEYRLVPLSAGKKTIAPITFCFFDPGRGAYLSASSPPFTVQVTAAEKSDVIVAAAEKAQPKVLEITLSEGELSPNIVDLNELGDQRTSVLTTLAIVLACPLLYIAFAWPIVRRRRLLADPARLRRRGALGRARERLRAAQRLAPSQADTALRASAEAVRGFVADLADLPEEGLTGSEVLDFARRRQLAEEDLATLKAFFDHAEAASFAGSLFGPDVLDEIQAVAALLPQMRTPDQHRPLIAPALALAALASGPDPGRPALFQEAQRDFNQAKYDLAAATYERILADGYENGAVLYNLGNTYLRMGGHLAQAIACYRRAERYRPGDANLQANLRVALARRKAVIASSGDSSLLDHLLFWRRKIGYPAKLRWCAAAALLTLALALARLILRGSRRWWWAVGLGVLATALLGASACLDWADARPGTHAVIAADQTPLRYGASASFEAYDTTLSTGCECHVLGRRTGDDGAWLKVRIGGHEGWIPAASAVLY